MRSLHNALVPNSSVLKKYGYLWVTLVLFLVSAIGHWTSAWYVFVEEQKERNQPADTRAYVLQITRDTLENWQSEFLQLIWQVAGLSFLWYLGSPQSREGDDRKEEKIDEILKKISGKQGEKIISALDRKYPRA